MIRSRMRMPSIYDVLFFRIRKAWCWRQERRLSGKGQNWGVKSEKLDFEHRRHRQKYGTCTLCPPSSAMTPLVTIFIYRFWFWWISLAQTVGIASDFRSQADGRRTTNETKRIKRSAIAFEAKRCVHSTYRP